VSELHTALAVAYRHIDDPSTTFAEREAVLATMAITFPSQEAELAAQTLHHLREQRRHQMTLSSILEASSDRRADL
jgi:hypothetical protein